MDFTLRSAVELFEGHLLAVILTGMGRDGLAAAASSPSMRQAARYGMPKSVIQASVADQITELPRIAKSIERLLAVR